MTGRDLMTDDAIRRALEPYRQVRASEALRAAVARAPEVATEPAPGRRHVGAVAAGAMAAAVAAVAAIVVVVVMLGPTRPDDAPSPGGATLDLTDARTVLFADGTTVPVDDLFDAANHERLRALFAEHDAELVVHERPVDPAADGRVYSVTIPNGTYTGTGDRVRLEAGVSVAVEVGRGDAAAATDGLTLDEVFPEIEAAIDREDPVATGRALERLGFRIRWDLIEAPGFGYGVEAPPAGTVVISVLGPDGQWTDIEPTTDTLTVEVASPEVAEELGH